jgi:hypothetical protein
VPSSSTRPTTFPRPIGLPAPASAHLPTVCKSEDGKELRFEFVRRSTIIHVVGTDDPMLDAHCDTVRSAKDYSFKLVCTQSVVDAGFHLELERDTSGKWHAYQKTVSLNGTHVKPYNKCEEAKLVPSPRPVRPTPVTPVTPPTPVTFPPGAYGEPVPPTPVTPVTPDK